MPVPQHRDFFGSLARIGHSEVMRPFADRSRLLVALVVAAGLALVVVASAAGPLWDQVTPSRAFLAVVLVAAAALAPELAVQGWRRVRSALIPIGVLVVVVGLLAFGVSRLVRSTPPPPKSGVSLSRIPKPFGGSHPRHGAGTHHVHHHLVVSPWLIAVVAVVLLAVCATGVWVALRRGGPEPLLVEPPVAESPPELTPEQRYSLLADTLDDLRAEPDVRRAIVAAYARMERGLGAFGMSRRPSETPMEYLTRGLGRLVASAGAAQRLTDLFELAAFGTGRLDASVKLEAIASLEAMRDEVGTWAAAG
jgi:hypothetical protein